jgi:hypothetical protein
VKKWPGVRVLVVAPDLIFYRFERLASTALVAFRRSLTARQLPFLLHTGDKEYIKRLEKIAVGFCHIKNPARPRNHRDSECGTSNVRPSAMVILNGRPVRIASRKAPVAMLRVYS